MSAPARPPNNELQRTSDGNAAGSPLNSVFARPAPVKGEDRGLTDHRAWHFGVWSRERTWATGLYKSACRCARRGGPASSQHCALEKERGIGTWGAGLTPDGRTGDAPGLSPRPHAPCRAYHSGATEQLRLWVARARRAGEQGVAADERRAFSVGGARFARAS